MDWGMLAAFGAGMVQKHLFKKLPNSAIPWINLGLMTGVGYATTGDISAGVTFGIQSAGGATLGHSMLKAPLSKTKLRNI
jgi:hypothetical protein